MSMNKKIGIIQNFSIAGDFSKNLRALVQGYRSCIDQGADLVIASAYALCGIEPQDLIRRESFLEQTENALIALSQEINCAPLILAAYSNELSEREELELLGMQDEELMDYSIESRLGLFLLEEGNISQLEEAELIEHAGLTFCAELGHEESLSDLEDLDFILRFGTQAWYAGSCKKEHESRSWEAEFSHTPHICVNPVGAAEGFVYAGASCAYDAKGKLIKRLALFDEDAQVFSLTRQGSDEPLPSEEELLRQALVLSIKKAAELGAFRGACVAMDQTYAPLLLLLTVEALGREQVQGISFRGENAFLNQLGLKCHQIELGDIPYQLGERSDLDEQHLLSLSQRVQACLTTGVAEKHHLLLLSSLNRQELVLGSFTLYAQNCANMLPLGSLYEIDLYLLSQHLSKDYPGYFSELPLPARPELGRIIHESLDRNQSSSSLLHKYPDQLQEKDVRYVQRRAIASAQKRSQLPLIVHTERVSEIYSYPVYHKLND